MKRLSVVLMLLVATWALAADPETVENDRSSAAGNEEPVEVRGVPDLPINQAEIQQYGAEDKSAGVDETDIQMSNPLMKEFIQIQETAALRLDELNTQLANQSNEEEALLLIKEMERVKQETELDMLRLQANAALARGDQATADEINQALTTMSTPRPARPAVERSASAGSGR